MNLARLLDDFVKRNSLGEVFIAPCDVVLSDFDVVQPDLLFVSKDRAHIITEANIQGPPDLVVEVLSLSTAERDRTLKKTLYARFGVKEYWLVDPVAGSIEVLALERRGFKTLGTCTGDAKIASRVLKALALTPSRIF